MTRCLAAARNVLQMCQEATFAPLHVVLCIDQAKEAIKEAQRCDPESVFTHFCVYKVATLEHNVEKGTGKASPLAVLLHLTSLVFKLPSATEALNSMGPLCKNPQSSDSRLLVSDTAASSLLSLAAQMALEVWCTVL